MARHPTDFKSANSIEKIVTEVLAENQNIRPEEKTSKITLTSWVNYIKTYMEERGLYTVFWVYDASTDVENYLLKYWGSAEPKIIQQWVDTLRTGVPDTQASIDAAGNKSTPVYFPPLQLVCEYDLENFKWSGKAIMQIISLELWETIEKDLDCDPSGPEAFASVVYKSQ